MRLPQLRHGRREGGEGEERRIGIAVACNAAQGTVAAPRARAPPEVVQVETRAASAIEHDRERPCEHASLGVTRSPQGQAWLRPGGAHHAERGDCVVLKA